EPLLISYSSMNTNLSVPIILLITVATYLIIIILLFLILRQLFPHSFISKAGLSSGEVEQHAIIESQYQMLDLSCLSQCAPCDDCSLRAILRRICPVASLDRLKRGMTVDWLRRPIVEGDGLHLVCCTTTQ
ncbi:hypothetical protein PMAYCL1PPCAC_12298, partial [Pristionchus mayeri]